MAWPEVPFCPWPCRCTFTIVASTIAYSMSGCSLTASNRRWNTSALTQSLKRLNTVFPLAELWRQVSPGLPVRAIHSTASTKRRLSVPLRPGSLGFAKALRLHLGPLLVCQYHRMLCAYCITAAMVHHGPTSPR